MTEIVGVRPCLPWPLENFPWWTEPIPAERLAALRIGTAVVLLFDIVVLYVPYITVMYGRAGLGGPGVFGPPMTYAYWSVAPLSGVAEPWHWQVLMIIWSAAALALLVGWRPRLAAFVAWFLSAGAIQVNPWIHTGGDIVRNILLFYLMLCPCGAVWSLGRPRRAERVLVYPWPARLLFVQLCWIYFMCGVFKLKSPEWVGGLSMAYFIRDLYEARVSAALLSLPAWLTTALGWIVLAWELGFPLLVASNWTRLPALWLGILFHALTLGMTIWPFPLYMMCLYLPLVPWETYRVRRSAVIRPVKATADP